MPIQFMPATSISPWPYQSGNALVDIILFAVWAFLFGLFAAYGWRVAQKIP